MYIYRRCEVGSGVVETARFGQKHLFTDGSHTKCSHGSGGCNTDSRGRTVAEG